jgi:hypothetical protein
LLFWVFVVIPSSPLCHTHLSHSPSPSLSHSPAPSPSLTMVLASDEQQPLAGTAQQAPGSFYQQQPNAVPYQGATAPPPSTTAHQPQPQYNIPSPYTQAASSNAPTYMQPGAAPYYTQSAAVVSPYGGQTVYTQVQQPYQQNPAGTVYIVHNDPRTEGHVAAAATTLILGFCCCWVWLFGLMYDIPHSHALSLSLSLSPSLPPSLPPSLSLMDVVLTCCGASGLHARLDQQLAAWVSCQSSFSHSLR